MHILAYVDLECVFDCAAGQGQAKHSSDSFCSQPARTCCVACMAAAVCQYVCKNQGLSKLDLQLLRTASLANAAMYIYHAMLVPHPPYDALHQAVQPKSSNSHYCNK